MHISPHADVIVKSADIHTVVFIELICTIIMIRRSGTAGLAGRLVLNTSGVCILRLQISNWR